tara:strand:+ start:1932 stop:2105 length:174 start_codon:yes stop_codon:yes gene_type:complete
MAKQQHITKNNECPECCGEGFDLDHFYETGGEEEDCYMCGGTGIYVLLTYPIIKGEK